MTASTLNPESAALIPGHPSPYSVKLSVFEGPLDLLLHLIRLNEVEITDIPIARIGEQYLEYLSLMRELDLDLVGEYLVMASTLAWIKSRMLLPAESMGEDGEEIDPRAELVVRLLEYQRFKEVASELGERKRLGRDVFVGGSSDLAPPAESDREIEVGLFDLVEAYRRVLERNREAVGRPHEIESEEISVRDRMLQIMEVLEARASIEFDTLLLERNGHSLSRSFVVATFLAILELTRLAAMRLYQGIDENGVPGGPIHLRQAGALGDRSWVESMGDLM